MMNYNFNMVSESNFKLFLIDSTDSYLSISSSLPSIKFLPYMLIAMLTKSVNAGSSFNANKGYQTDTLYSYLTHSNENSAMLLVFPLITSRIIILGRVP